MSDFPAEPESLPDVTAILQSYAQSDGTSHNELFSILYSDLKNIAIGKMKREQAGHTLQATALVHETFLKLMNLDSCRWENRYHFFVSASEIMRRILIDHARTKGRIKRGGQHKRVTIDDLDFTLDHCQNHETTDSLLLLNEALAELEQLAPEKAQVVKLRFFGRMTYEQIAEMMNVSKATIERYWVFSKAWLNRHINESSNR